MTWITVACSSGETPVMGFGREMLTELLQLRAPNRLLGDLTSFYLS